MISKEIYVADILQGIWTCFRQFMQTKSKLDQQNFSRVTPHYHNYNLAENQFVKSIIK